MPFSRPGIGQMPEIPARCSLFQAFRLSFAFLLLACYTPPLHHKLSHTVTKFNEWTGTAMKHPSNECLEPVKSKAQRRDYRETNVYIPGLKKSPGCWARLVPCISAGPDFASSQQGSRNVLACHSLPRSLLYSIPPTVSVIAPPISKA